MKYKTGKWSEKEEQLLKDNVHLPMKDLVILLNRSEGSIRGKKTNLGISSGRNIPFTEEEKQIIEKYYRNNPSAIDLDKLSKKINRQKTSICRYARKAGLTNQCRTFTDSQREKCSKIQKEIRETEYYKNVIKPKMAEKLKEHFRNPNNHPRGFLGKHHTEDAKRRISESNIEVASRMSKEEKHKRAMKAVDTKIKTKKTSNTTSNTYSRTKSGKRKDLNDQFFRSSWEANIARLLNYENIDWEYESKRFYFSESINGVVSYQPDFYLPKYDKWIEVKGWMDEKSKNRLKLLKEQYPVEYSKLILIDEKFYNELRDELSLDIDNWEYSKNEKKKFRKDDLDDDR